jgi:hypothetical protein
MGKMKNLVIEMLNASEEGRKPSTQGSEARMKEKIKKKLYLFDGKLKPVKVVENGR